MTPSKVETLDVERLIKCMPLDLQPGAMASWHSHLHTDPHNIVAQWAFIHFSLLCGTNANAKDIELCAARLDELCVRISHLRTLLDAKEKAAIQAVQIADSQTAAQLKAATSQLATIGQKFENVINGVEASTRKLATAGNAAEAKLQSLTDEAKSWFDRSTLLLCGLLLGIGVVIGMGLVLYFK